MLFSGTFKEETDLPNKKIGSEAGWTDPKRGISHHPSHEIYYLYLKESR